MKNYDLELASGKAEILHDFAALEQRFDSLSTKFSAMVEENAALEKLCGDLDNLLCEYEAKLDSIFNYVQDGVEPSDFMLSFSVVREVFDKVDQYERRCEEAEQDRDELKEKLDKVLNGPVWYWVDVAEEYEAENALLRKRLEPIQECYNNITDYRINDFIDTIKECMEMASKTDEK